MHERWQLFHDDTLELDLQQLELCKFGISTCWTCRWVATNLKPIFLKRLWTNNNLFIAANFFNRRNRGGNAHWNKNVDPEASDSACPFKLAGTLDGNMSCNQIFLM